MLSLRQFRSRAKGLPDLLNYAALVDDGIVLQKDGSLLAGWFYEGPDLASSTPDERNFLTDRINAALARLGTGWAIWIDAVRLPASSYPHPDASHFPDDVSRMIDEERRRQFLAEGAHHETEYALTVQYYPPCQRHARLAAMVYDVPSGTNRSIADLALDQFKRSINALEDSLSAVLKVRRLRGYSVTGLDGTTHHRDELLNYLACCLMGRPVEVNLPPAAMYLDSIIAGIDFWPGDMPRLGSEYVAVVGIEGLPGESYQGILEGLDHLPVAYRWSSRFISLDAREAIAALHKFRRQWKQRERGFFEQVFRTGRGVVNEDAKAMVQQAEAAIGDANSGLISYGYYTPIITIRGPDQQVLAEQAREVVRTIERVGFVARIETINATEALLGSLPGHAVPNIRRPLMHSLNLADLAPLSSVWAGRDEAPCPFYSPGAPPLLHAATTGSTPFRFNLHVGDLGHTLVVGPPGSGKSTLLALLAAQFRRYENTTIWAFDKGRSLQTLTRAVGGCHYDLGAEGQTLSFCPLSELETDADIAWAEEWLAACYELRAGERPSVHAAQEIHRALLLLRGAPHDGRSMTHFCGTVQDVAVRDALAHYTLQGALGHLLDASHDGLLTGSMQVFEIEELMNMGPQNLLPVLLYLFRRFSQALRGSPALLVLDEAWVLLGHPVFRAKIVEWLKVLRKANCAVVMATQSLSDLVKSGIVDVLQESCPTHIFLANRSARQEGSHGIPGPRDFYAMMGLNDAQVDLIGSATPKRHYYVTSSEGRRLIELNLGPLALSFLGISDKKSLAEIDRLEQEHGTDWPRAWLQTRKVTMS